MYTQQRYVLMTLDPVHIGTGGYRLGRVDLSIVREPGTNLPKIPGTSLSGAVRQYAARRYAKPQCAGQGSKDGKPHCGQSTCPICYTFGSIKGAEGGNAGTVNIGDARLLLFPVYSLAGPVWVSTVEQLQEAGFTVTAAQPTDSKVAVTLTDWKDDKPLNLGWLLLEVEKGARVTPPQKLLHDEAWNTVSNRIVLVTPKLFGQIVNNNLEVRTSVSIDPLTGAAQQGALFTYEALPRATFLWLEVVVDDYRTGTKPWPVSKKFNKDENEDNAGDALGETWQRPLDVVAAGLEWAEHLGIGGMGTRGFGRIKLVGDWEVSRG